MTAAPSRGGLQHHESEFYLLMRSLLTDVAIGKLGVMSSRANDLLHKLKHLEALRLAAKPDEDGVRETTIEECAKIVDAECERILSKQTLTTAGDLVTQNAVNANLRMIACFLPELSASIRALSTTGEPKR